MFYLLKNLSFMFPTSLSKKKTTPRRGVGRQHVPPPPFRRCFLPSLHVGSAKLTTLEYKNDFNNHQNWIFVLTFLLFIFWSRDCPSPGRGRPQEERKRRGMAATRPKRGRNTAPSLRVVLPFSSCCFSMPWLVRCCLLPPALGR